MHASVCVCVCVPCTSNIQQHRLIIPIPTGKKGAEQGKSKLKQTKAQEGNHPVLQFTVWPLGLLTQSSRLQRGLLALRLQLCHLQHVYSFLGCHYSLSAAHFSEHPMVLAFSTSWSFHCSVGSTFSSFMQSLQNLLTGTPALACVRCLTRS